MSDRMMPERKKVANSSFTPSSITSTNSTRGFGSKSSMAPLSRVTDVFTNNPNQAPIALPKMPDLQTQLEKASRFGHDISRISLAAPVVQLTTSQLSTQIA